MSHPRPTVIRRATMWALAALLAGAVAPAARAQHLLVPMDEAQQNHLKAYGLTYNTLKAGMRAEWLLNYRGGSFLLPDAPDVRRRAALAGVSVEPTDDAALQRVRTEIAAGNMDAVPLEKAPRVAIYTPPDAPPWDDAVTLALQYAGIDYTTVWDAEVVGGELSKYDWLHLHHEDFTGQLNKLYISYRDAPWFVQQQAANAAMAKQLGFPNVPALKKAVAEGIRSFVEKGGFLFAMCGATETLELAIAGHDVDIAAAFADGTPVAMDADRRMDWGRAMAFRDAHLEHSPYVNAMSDIDGHQVNVPGRRQPLGAFTLFDFSAKFDPVATMLVQDHRSVIPDFYGVTTSFTKATLKPGDTVLAFEEGAPWVKYIHGDYGKGSWTFLGGHDPEDPQHNIGAAPTDLSLHPNSPGYRLILNNVLFPAAKKKPLKT
ncbi:MAG TPA: hypothetical protein VF048_02890 [Gemmatimonadaceae bacterium]